MLLWFIYRFYFWQIITSILIIVIDLNKKTLWIIKSIYIWYLMIILPDLNRPRLPFLYLPRTPTLTLISPVSPWKCSKIEPPRPLLLDHLYAVILAIDLEMVKALFIGFIIKYTNSVNLQLDSSSLVGLAYNLWIR